jgi:hypothetical protein
VIAGVEATFGDLVEGFEHFALFIEYRGLIVAHSFLCFVWSTEQETQEREALYRTARNGPSSHEVQDFLVKFGELLPTIFVSTL